VEAVDRCLQASGRSHRIAAWSTSASARVAPIDGVVIFLVTSLAMNAGDPLLAVAG